MYTQVLISLEFFDSTVVYNIKSPTVDLNSVYFPSVVVCNLNILRRSFIMSLLNDTKISQNVDFVQLSSLIDNYFLSGGNIELTNNEQDIINSKPMPHVYRLQARVTKCFESGSASFLPKNHLKFFLQFFAKKHHNLGQIWTHQIILLNSYYQN